MSNGIIRAISDDIISKHESEVEYCETNIMDEVSRPFPQISHFIRNVGFPWSWPDSPRSRTEALRSIGLSSGSPEFVLKQYEQDVYDLSRSLGLSIDDAERWVLRARRFWSEGSNLGPLEHSDDAPGESTSDGLQVNPSAQLSNKSAGDSTFRSKDKIEDNLHITTINELKGPEQLQQPEFPYFKFDRRSDNDTATPATLKPSTLSAESLVDNEVSHDEEASKTDTAFEREEKAWKRARKALKQERKKATTRADKRKRKKGEDRQIANLEGPAEAIKTVEEVSQFEQLEDKDKSQRQRKKGRKRKEELEVPPHFEVHYGGEVSQFEQLDDKAKSQRQKKKGRKREEEFEVLPQSEVHCGEQQQRLKNRRVESDAQDVKSRKSKIKKRSPYYSPFFQRSSLTEAGKDVNRKVNQLMDHGGSGFSFKKDVAIDEAKMLVDFQTPMI